MTMEDAALIEPLSVAVHAVVNIGNFRATQTIAVWGAGPVGLLCMAVAKALGAARVIAIDIVLSRLEFAKTYAATDVFLPPVPNPNESGMEYSKRCADTMMKEFGLRERGGINVVDVVVDASGAEPSIQTGLHVVKAGGTFVQLGMGTPDVQIPMTLMLIKEVTVKGSFRYGPGDYPLAISLVAQGKVDLKPLVTHRYPFDQAIEAFKATQAGKSDDGKPVIKAIISGPDVSPNDNS
jgi:D-xylulose reductase